ncbi:MAG: hypothetical protein AB1634_05650 [Thermodesulfobacteriota bacterium]
MGNGTSRRPHLGEILIQRGLVSAEVIDEALRIQVGGNRRLGYLLLKMKAISEAQLVEVLSEQLRLPAERIGTVAPEAKGVLPRYLCRRYNAVPLRREANNVLVLAMTDPLDQEAVADIDRYTGLVAKPVLAGQSEIDGAVASQIPLSMRDIFNPQVFNRLARLATAVSLILILVLAVSLYQDHRLRKYGTVTEQASTVVYKNHDLMVGKKSDGKVTLQGHAAFDEGVIDVRLDGPAAFSAFVEGKKPSFSGQQYEWLQWLIRERLARAG